MKFLYILTVIFGAATLAHSGSRSCYKKSNYKYKPITRKYCISATQISWNYAPHSTEDQMDLSGLYEEDAQSSLAESDVNIGSTYQKYVYREYDYNNKRKNCDWETPSEHPPINGLMGPTIRAVVGDTVKVHFKNNCTGHSHSIVPRGLFYSQDFDMSVSPGDEVLYTWMVHDNSGPRYAGSVLSSQTWMYHGAQSHEKDLNSGLVGAIVVVDKRYITSDSLSSSATPCDVDQEVVLMAGTFDESKSWLTSENVGLYLGSDQAEALAEDEEFVEANTMHTLNGYVYGNLNQDVGLVVNVGSRVRWSIIDVNTDESVVSQSILWNMNSVSDSSGHFDTSVTLASPGYTAVDMSPEELGEWTVSSGSVQTAQAGMVAVYSVQPALASSGDDDASAMVLGNGSFYAVLATIVAVGVVAVLVMAFFMVKSAFNVPMLQSDMNPILLGDSSHHPPASVFGIGVMGGGGSSPGGSRANVESKSVEL